MSYKPHFTSGDWLAICDACGRLYEASNLLKRWDGFMTCPTCWEIRQPQDFVRGVVDKQTTPWVRDEASDQFRGPVCTVFSIQAVANLGTADCARAGYDLGQRPTNADEEYTSIAHWAVAGFATPSTLLSNR